MTSARSYRYVIVGGGLAGASAVEGIRSLDQSGSILLVGSERHLPYDRPPLTKKLWFGKKKVGEIFLHDRKFYRDNGVELLAGAKVVSVDAAQRTVSCQDGSVLGYGKLLVATGSIPRTLSIPGGGLDGVCCFRGLDDYQRLRADALEGRSAVVIGGGFIGSEISAALSVNKVQVTMIFPSPYLCDRVFPDYLGLAVQREYARRGIRVLAKEKPASVRRDGRGFVTRTDNGMEVVSDMVIVGVGVAPELDLARSAGLRTGDGIEVDERLRSSNEDIYAAGDNALFPYQALGRRARVEHWDNALAQGRLAGRNMAGGHEVYDHMPYFFSDLFEFGYEAVGEVDSRLATVADWRKEFEEGVIYYLADGLVRGVMLCNVWDKVDAARELIRKGAKVAAGDLRGAIR